VSQLHLRPASPDDQARQAQLAARAALRRGTLVRPAACECCGDQRRLFAHHRDYTRPLDVEWLCARCHKTVHGLWGYRGAAALQPQEAVA